MSDLRRHNHPPKVSQFQHPPLRQSHSASFSRSSLRFADQNKYQKFMVGSRWKEFILPEFVEDNYEQYQNQDCQSVSSKNTFSRVEQSRTRTLNDVRGYDLDLHTNHTPNKRILLDHNSSSKQNIHNQYPQISAFSLKKNRTSSKFWSNSQLPYDRFEKQSLSSISKPFSVSGEEMCSVGIQTDEVQKKLTEEEIESLKEEVDYLRKFVFSSFEDGFKKVKGEMETPKKEFYY